MRYLQNFFINENVAQAKALLKKISISETDPDFIKIREMLRGHDGYVYWFTKLRFSDNQSMDELKNIWNAINDNSGLVNFFTKKVVDLEKAEDFWDQYERAKLVSGAKKVLNQFPANQKRLFNLEDQKDFDLLVSLSKSKSLPALIRKISSYRDKKSLVDAANRLLSSSFEGKFDELIKLINSVDADIKVADEENNIIICQVTYPQIKVLGGDTSWCIVGSQGTFNSYAGGGFQWVIFLVDNFGTNDRMSKIGLTTHYGFTTAHDKYDGFVNKERLEKILEERGVDLSDFYISKENLSAMDNWDQISVELLIAKGFTKEQIIKRKNIFRDKSKYYRQSVSKSDIEYFTEDEKEKWDLEDKIEITWSYVSKISVENILKRNLINRLDNAINFTNLKQLDITKQQILDYKIYESDKVYLNTTDLNYFTKEEIIKYKIIKFIRHGVTLSFLIKNGFTKQDIIDNEIYKFGNIGIDAESLSYFSKEELINYKIIDKANSIPYNILFSLGFTKKEITEKYSNVLDGLTRNVVEFFKGKTKVQVRNRLYETFWSDDRAKLGVNHESEYKVILLAMTLYDIDSTMISLTKKRGSKNLYDLFRSTRIEVEKSNLETLYSLGFKIVDKDTFSIFMDIFMSDRGNTVSKIADVIKFRSFFNKGDIEYGFCTKYLLKSLKPSGDFGSRLWFDYFDLAQYKNILFSCEEKDEILSALKKSKMDRYSWDFKTKREKDAGYGSYSNENTIKFMEILGVTKKEIELRGLKKFVSDVFEESSSSIDPAIKYLEGIGFELDEDDIIEIIKGALKPERSSTDDKGEKITIYDEDYYQELIDRDIRVQESLPWLQAYFEKNNKLSEYQEKNYRDLFAKGGKKWIAEFEKKLEYVKQKELYYKVVSDLKDVFGSGTYRRGMSPEKWYETYFDIYPKVEDKFHGWDKNVNDIKVIWILAKLDKLDEIESFYDWSSINANDGRRTGFSFDNNLLHSIAKLLCRVDSEYDRTFSNLSLSDEQIKNLYKLVVSKVDESQYWVKKYLLVCYYLYDKRKYNKFVSEVSSMRNNYSYNKYNRYGDFKEKANMTFRIDAFRYILKYLAKKDNFTEFKKLVDMIMINRKSTSRALKMTNVEYKQTLEFLEDYCRGNRDFNEKKEELIKSIKKEYNKVEESFILKWNEYKKVN